MSGKQNKRKQIKKSCEKKWFSNKCFRKKCCSVLILFFGINGLQAAELPQELQPELPSVVSFEGGGDAEGSKDGYLDLDYSLPAGYRLLFSGGSSRSDSQDDSVTTKNSLLGFRSDPLKAFSAGIDLEHWGNKESLTTDTLRLLADVGLDNWFISLQPQWRKVTFITDCIALIIANCKPEETVNSSGLAININYFTDGPWGFSLGYAKHEYDREIEALYQYPVFELIFSAATLDLAAGIEDYRSSLGVSYATSNSLWSFSRLKSVSKVSAATSFVSTLRFSTDINEHWRLRLRAGSQTNEDNTDRIGFAGAGFAYSW